MPENAERWRQRMIEEGRMKDADGYYHYTLRKDESEYERVAELYLTKLLDFDIIR